MYLLLYVIRLKSHTLTVQIVSAVDQEVVFSPHVDHGCVFLHQGRVDVLKQDTVMTYDLVYELM